MRIYDQNSSHSVLVIRCSLFCATKGKQNITKFAQFITLNFIHILDSRIPWLLHKNQRPKYSTGLMKKPSTFIFNLWLKRLQKNLKTAFLKRLQFKNFPASLPIRTNLDPNHRLHETCYRTQLDRIQTGSLRNISRFYYEPIKRVV